MVCNNVVTTPSAERAVLCLGDGMGLVVPFPDLIAPLLVFLDSNHHIGYRLVAPPQTFVAGAGAAPRLYRQQNDIVRDGGGATKLIAGGSRQHYVWDLPNGRVQFDHPFFFDGIMMPRVKIVGNDPSLPSSAPIALWDPKFLGSGGSGAVFSFSTSPDSSPYDSERRTTDRADERIAIKVSWKRSNESVQKECSILQNLASVPHLERCIGGPNEYPYEDGRTMIALTPVMASSAYDDDITSDLNKVNPGIPQRKSVNSVVETMVEILKLGIYTVDVQPLINKETGEVLFIDFTEANRLSIPLTPVDESALVGFCGEMFALIPDSLRGLAVEVFKTEMNGLNNDTTTLPEKVIDILESVWLE